MAHFPLVSTSQGIMAIGGSYWRHVRVCDKCSPISQRTDKDEILQLKCPDGQALVINRNAYKRTKCQWQEYPKKLDVARGRHVVIALPASYEICIN